MANDKTVLVVGAGISGLAAARELAHRGYNVTVLEGRDRVGGRISSVEIGNGAVDMGASFIHGISGNPLSTVAREMGITAVPFEQCVLYQPDGWPVDSRDDRQAEQAFNEALEKCHQAAERVINEQTDEHASPVPKEKNENSSIVNSSLDELMSVENSELMKRLSDSEWKLFEWHRSNLEIACGADFAQLSGVHWNQDDRYQFDGDHVMLREGYGCMTRALAKTLKIHFNVEVRLIRLDKKCGGTSAVCMDGRTFSADFLVCTLPLGVLKSRSVRFEPALPKAKMDSIRALGYGCLNKVAMLFPSVFWNRVDFIGHVADERGHWVLFADLSRITDQPILLAMAGGSFASSMEALSDERIINQILEVLKRIFKTVPNPLKTEISRWKRDKFSKGSFSFISSDATAKDYDTLAEPLCDCKGVPRVLFAGEATTRYHPSTTTGAWLTGLREAMRIDMLVRPEKHKESFDPNCVYTCSIRFPRISLLERLPSPAGTPTKTVTVSNKRRKFARITSRFTRGSVLESQEDSILKMSDKKETKLASERSPFKRKRDLDDTVEVPKGNS